MFLIKYLFENQFKQTEKTSTHYQKKWKGNKY